MMNDIRALCSVNDPGLVQFIGAYHAPENGQVHARLYVHPATPASSVPVGDVTASSRGTSLVRVFVGRLPSCWST